jgi:gluconokinase
MDYFLGIDIGTTAVKAVAFAADGKVLHEQSAAYPMLHPMPDRSEQDPEDIARALFQAVEKILYRFRQLPPRLVGFSSAMHSLIAVDEQGRPLTPCIIWADNRAADIASRLHREHRAAGLYQRTGVPVHAMSPFCKLLWMKENDPTLFRRAARFIGIKEYIFFKWFGRWAVDASIASATGLMNLHAGQWDPVILEAAGIGEERLSPIVPVHEIFRDPAPFPALKGIPLAIGGSDGALANLGVASGRSLVVSIGTSSAARILVQRPVTDKDMRNFCYYVKDGLYLAGGASNNGGVVLQWLKEKWFMEEDLPGLLELAAGVKPGCDGLIFLPYILGERAPIWNANAKGVLSGLTVNHGREHLARAALEAVVRCVYAIGRPLLEISGAGQIDVTGGFARSGLGLQVLADMFNLPVRVTETVEHAAWGAVKLGMEAMGMTPEAGEQAISLSHPCAENHAIYQQQFEQSEKLYALLKETW